MKHQLIALKLREQNNDFIGIASSLRELGSFYLDNKDYESAAEHLERALQIYRQVGDKRGITWSTNYMAELYLKQNRLKEALNYAIFSHSNAMKLGLKELIKRTSLTLFHIYKTKGSAENALKFFEQYVAIKDSLNDESYNKLLIQMKIQKEIDELSAKNRETIAAQNEQLKLKNFQNKMMYGGIGILILFSGFAVNRLYVTWKQKKVIEKQKKEVETKGNEAEKQRKIAELKNREILDSIHYASRVQSAILPPEHLIKLNFPESFIFYKPKDIIAGDFYWMSQKESYIYLAVADCTGHGVPGAMVSVVCHSALDKAINVFNCYSPSEILNKSRSIIIEEFSKTAENEISDGMDISLMRVNKSNKEILWAGANSSLIYFNAEGINEIKGNKQPIGKYLSDEVYEDHRLDGTKISQLHFFTDGIKDQFGGLNGKKLKKSGVFKFLIEHHELPMELQKLKLEEFFNRWKGHHNQVDDVCFVGLSLLKT